LYVGQNQTPARRGSNANTPRRRNRQISDSRTVVVDEQTGSQRRRNSTIALSYQQVTVAGESSVLTSSEYNIPPSDATSIEDISDIRPSQLSGDFDLDSIAMGHQFK
jgi:hypothetical protein